MNTSRWAKADSPGASNDLPAADIKEPPSATNASFPESNDVPLYPADDSIDEFAQTRPPDDLFDDDFTPLEQPAVPEPIQPTPDQHRAPLPSRGAHPHRGARRGRFTARASTAQPTNRNPTPPEDKKPRESDLADNAEPSAVAESKPEKRDTAVRGDRSGTGGLKREKLTEEELSAKLDAMKIKNASLMEKHAKSQADEESFHAREAIAAQKRKEERVNRQHLMGERERNRQRKLQAQGGREWDLEKDDKDFSATDSRRPKRGAHGGITSNSRPDSAERSEVSSHHQQDTPRGSTRGRRSDRGRGRSYRNGHSSSDARPQAHPQSQSQSQSQSQQQHPPTANDFPELPTLAKQPESANQETPKPLTFPGKKIDTSTLVLEPRPAGEKTSWADEVEAA